MVHFICFVLAIGPSGFGSVSHRMVIAASVPDHWNCRRGRARFNRLHHHASGATIAKDLEGRFKRPVVHENILPHRDMLNDCDS